MLTPTGTKTILHDFGSSGDFGNHPQGGVIASKDGNFYGTTRDGGDKGEGTIFKLAVGPAIISPATAIATVGKAFSYQITATRKPTSFGVQRWPEGLGVNATTGLISGTRKAVGTYSLTLNCYNRAGKGSTTLILTITSLIWVIG